MEDGSSSSSKSHLYMTHYKTINRHTYSSLRIIEKNATDETCY